jgi:hypothetical protein
MEVDIKTLMLLFFILFLTLSIWKIWAFLPNKQLKDDDKMKGSEDNKETSAFALVSLYKQKQSTYP